MHGVHEEGSGVDRRKCDPESALKLSVSHKLVLDTGGEPTDRKGKFPSVAKDLRIPQL